MKSTYGRINLLAVFGSYAAACGFHTRSVALFSPLSYHSSPSPSPQARYALGASTTPTSHSVKHIFLLLAHGTAPHETTIFSVSFSFLLQYFVGRSISTSSQRTETTTSTTTATATKKRKTSPTKSGKRSPSRSFSTLVTCTKTTRNGRGGRGSPRSPSGRSTYLGRRAAANRSTRRFRPRCGSASKKRCVKGASLMRFFCLPACLVVCVGRHACVTDV